MLQCDPQRPVEPIAGGLKVQAFELTVPDLSLSAQLTGKREVPMKKVRYGEATLLNLEAGKSYHVFGLDPDGVGGAISYVAVGQASEYAADIRYVYVGRGVPL